MVLVWIKFWIRNSCLKYFEIMVLLDIDSVQTTLIFFFENK
jgi:hypothetical protein